MAGSVAPAARASRTDEKNGAPSSSHGPQSGRDAGAAGWTRPATRPPVSQDDAQSTGEPGARRRAGSSRGDAQRAPAAWATESRPYLSSRRTKPGARRGPERPAPNSRTVRACRAPNQRQPAARETRIRVHRVEEDDVDRMRMNQCGSTSGRDRAVPAPVWSPSSQPSASRPSAPLRLADDLTAAPPPAPAPPPSLLADDQGRARMPARAWPPSPRRRARQAIQRAPLTTLYCVTSRSPVSPLAP